MGSWNSKTDAVHEAVRQGDHDTVNMLLDSGASVNCSQEAKSLLYSAILSRRYDLAADLVRKGAEVTSGFYTDTPLHLASRMGAGALVQYLLKYGASANVADHNNCTPLWGAVAENKMAAVQVLLRHPGIDVNQPCNHRFLKQGGCNSPLIEAVEADNLELVSLLCGHGVDLEQADTRGQTALHRACEHGHQEVVDYLISRGSNMDAVDQGNVTPLYLACERGHLAVATRLINTGCNVNISRNRSGWKHKLYSPLHVAVQEGHTDIVRLLCTLGNDLDICDSLDKTPLILACETVNLEIMQILLERGADVNRKDKFGRSPLVSALQPHQRWLQRKMNKCSSIPNHEADKYPKVCLNIFDEDNTHVRAVDMLLQAGADINPTGECDVSPICYAVLFGQADTGCVLLQHGAKIQTEQILAEQPKWEDDTMHKVLLYYSQESKELANRIIDKLPNHRKSLASSIGEIDNKPPSLLKLCRGQVVQTLQRQTETSIKPIIDKLPVPPTMKRFLFFEDMHNFVFQKTQSI